MQKKIKLDKENLRMAKLKKKQNGFKIQYDTMYLGSDMSLSSSSETEELEQSQLHEESQASEKEEILKKVSNDNIVNDERYSSFAKTMSLQSELAPKIEDDPRSSLHYPDLGSSISTHPISMPPTIAHSIPPSCFPPPLFLLHPSTANYPFPSSFSSQNIILRKNHLPISSSSTSINGVHARTKTEEKVRRVDWRRDEPIGWRREDGGGGKREEGSGLKREEDSGILKRRGKRKESERHLSNGSKMVSIMGTEVNEGNGIIIEMDRASIFKNYFPESNVNSVLEVYEKKRKILAYLHEAKLQSMLENNMVNKIDKIDNIMSPLLTNHFISIADDTPPAPVESYERIRRRFSKYTFYVSRMFDIFSQKRKKNREEGIHKKEDNATKHRLFRNMKRKTNFFENEGERKKLSDFILEIMKHPKYEVWKKRGSTQRKSLSIFRKKVK